MFFLWLILKILFWSLPILWTVYTIYWQRSSRCLPGCFSLDVVIDYWSHLVYFKWSKASCGPRIYVYWFGLKNYKNIQEPPGVLAEPVLLSGSVIYPGYMAHQCLSIITGGHKEGSYCAEKPSFLTSTLKSMANILRTATSNIKRFSSFQGNLIN